MTAKTMTLKFNRDINGKPADVYSAWLDPRNPANCWYGSVRLHFKPKKGDFYYFVAKDGREEYPHYGRFLALARGKRVEMTWMSRNTNGRESIVTVTFKPKGKGTRLSLSHSNLPDNADGRAHNDGWNYFLGELVKSFQ